MTASYASLIKICERLERAKRHGLTPFWSTVAERLYGGDADTLVAQVGRGGIKSGFGSRIALNEVINGDFEVPQGELHYWIDVSENKAEASQRLRQYENYLDVLGIAYERRGDEVVIPELRRGFLVRAFDAGKLAGFRAIGVRFDELAKAAPDAAEGREVVSSAVAMTITHVRHRPKLLLLSAPTGKTNFHFLQFSEGDGHGQIAVHAPTWEANPTVTREDTLRKCSHEPTWLMEYAAVRALLILVPLFLAFAVALVLERERMLLVLVIGACLSVLGFSVPRIYINYRAAARRREIERGLPVAVDLLTLGLSGGQNVLAALGRVAREIRSSFPCARLSRSTRRKIGAPYTAIPFWRR